jgi:chitinase
VLGVPAYGRTFYLKNKTEHGLSARSFSNGTQGKYTKTSGFLSYYEICEKKKKDGEWNQVWQNQSKSHYMYKENDWISYDDIKSYHLRVSYFSKASYSKKSYTQNTGCRSRCSSAAATNKFSFGY